MLARQEEVMMFVEQCAMESNQSLPLFVGQLVGRLGLLLTYLDALLLYHDEAGIYAFNFIDQLLMGDWSCLRLEQ